MGWKDLTKEEKTEVHARIGATIEDIDDNLIAGMARFMQRIVGDADPDHVPEKVVDAGVEHYLINALNRTLLMYFVRCCELSYEQSENLTCDIIKLLDKMVGDSDLVMIDPKTDKPI